MTMSHVVNIEIVKTVFIPGDVCVFNGVFTPGTISWRNVVARLTQEMGYKKMDRSLTLGPISVYGAISWGVIMTRRQKWLLHPFYHGNQSKWTHWGHYQNGHTALVKTATLLWSTRPPRKGWLRITTKTVTLLWSKRPHCFGQNGQKGVTTMKARCGRLVFPDSPQGHRIEGIWVFNN